MKRLIVLVACGALLLCTASEAQHAHHEAGQVVTLLPGLGVWKHPIGTKSPDAQKYFDQGLVMLYGFNRPEALRSFRKALELDPSAGMAQWGASMAIGPYLNMEMDPGLDLKGACAAAQSGLKMNGISATARDWLTAAAARCPDYSVPSKYVEAMRKLAMKYPDDPDAQTWLAEALLLPVRWKWYSGDGKAAPGVEEAERILEGLLRRYPDHPGANHLYIHAVESSATPERGIASAQRLMGIVPAAGHIVHMPGHIWLALGDYNTTIDVNERAAQVDREYFERTGMMSAYYMYYLHNLQFIVYTRSMQGRAADTRKAIAQIEEAGKAMPDFADFVTFLVTLAQARIGDCDALLNAKEPASAAGKTFWHFGKTVAFAAKGNRAQAASEQTQFETLRLKLDRNMVWDTNKLGDVLDVASAELDARLDSGSGAVQKWNKAVAAQERLAYDEPPGWYYPMRESLGAALLKSGNAAGAETVFREGLRRSPKNGRMLFGLLESLKAQHKTDAAAWVQREYERAWKGADIKLTIAIR
jgi:tetratricopeptide (TPR) repeat protein